MDSSKRVVSDQLNDFVNVGPNLAKSCYWQIPAITYAV